MLVAAVMVLATQQASWAVDLSGCWSGTWQSCRTPHHGPLHAQFVRLDESHYEVFFRGRFFKIFPFKYSVVMSATESDGVVHLSGSKFLGRLFGTFSFAATATDCHFHANYDSCKDNGLFELTRCTSCEPCEVEKSQ